MLFTFFCKRKNIKKETFMAEVIQNSNNFDKYDLICDVCGLDRDLMLQKRGSAFAQQVVAVE